MSRKTFAFVTLSLLACGVAHGQFTVINNRVSNITGTGARAMGMGGAFVALADDATAASWNPAGLAQLTRPEVSLVYDWSSGHYNLAMESTDTAPNGDRDVYTQTNPGHVGSSYLAFASATLPFHIGRHRLVAQMSYNRLSGVPHTTTSAVEKVTRYRGDVSSEETLIQAATSDRWSGGYDAYSLSLASEIGSHIRVGVSVNYIDAKLGERFREDFELPFWPEPALTALTYTFRDDSSFSAWQEDVGVQWTPAERWTFGAVYHTGFTATFKDSGEAALIFDPNGFWGGLPSSPATTAYETRVHWPDAYQLGIAWRATDRLIVAVDYGSTHWSSGKLDTYQAPCWDANGDSSPCPAASYPYPSGGTQHNTRTVRGGGEYTFYAGKRTFVPIRAGYFRDRQMGTMAGVPNTTEVPTVEGYTLGAGLTLGHFQFDFAWVRVKGDQSSAASYQTGDIATTEKVKADLDIDRYVASMIVRF